MHAVIIFALDAYALLIFIHGYARDGRIFALADKIFTELIYSAPADREKCAVLHAAADGLLRPVRQNKIHEARVDIGEHMGVAVREAPDISAARYDRRKQFVPEYAVGAGHGVDAVERLDAEARRIFF